MKTIRFTSKFAGWNLPPILLFLLAAVASSEEPAVERSVKDPSKCELVVEGEGVEKVYLCPQYNITNPNDSLITLDVKPGVSMFLPQGKYTVLSIDFQGGYRNENLDTLTLTPNAPCRYKVGVTLKSTLNVKRQGRLLKLDFQLLDVQGRKYNKIVRDAPPRFAVYQGDREIGSGSFEYG